MFGTCKFITTRKSSFHGTDSVRDLGLLYGNKILRSVVIMIVNDTSSVFLVAVVPVTFGPIWPWFRTDGHLDTARCLPNLLYKYEYVR